MPLKLSELGLDMYLEIVLFFRQVDFRFLPVRPLAVLALLRRLGMSSVVVEVTENWVLGGNCFPYTQPFLFFYPK